MHFDFAGSHKVCVRVLRLIWAATCIIIIIIIIIINKTKILYFPTSSTAQGGGGSFKNRKPIGEIGCCESGMAERIH